MAVRHEKTHHKIDFKLHKYYSTTLIINYTTFEISIWTIFQQMIGIKLWNAMGSDQIHQFEFS